MGDATVLAYVVLGLGLSVVGAVLALSLARASRSYYAADVYHLSVRSHRRFAVLSGAFAAAFLVAFRWPAIGIPLLAVYALLLVLYLSSFARGFSGDDE